MTDPLNEFVRGLAAGADRRDDDVQPWHSFWYHRPARRFPPRAILYPDEYDGSDRLAVACTQTDLPDRDQRRLVSRWCEVLPTLDEVRYLWFQSRTSQEMFEAACRMPGLEGLYVKWGAVKEFGAVAGLEHLRTLYMGGCPSLQPLESLHRLPHLEWLELHNIRATGDLSFVSELPGLRGLAIHGDDNSLKYIAVATLDPLRCLSRLEWLSLSTVTIADESLDALGELPSLGYLHLSNRVKMEAVARLAGLQPQVRCKLFEPVSDVLPWLTCRKCGKARMVLPTGKGKPFLCRDCDAARIAKHIESFRSIAASVGGRST